MRKWERLRQRFAGVPYLSAVLLGMLLLGCIAAELLMTKDPAYLDLSNCNTPPNREFLFGTDSLGRDIFSGIWYGGRISVFIGLASTLISTVIAVLYGTFSGLAPGWADTLLMRFADIFLSVPELLLILFIQAAFGEPNVMSISVVIGVSGWAGIAKIIRTEVRQLRNQEYIVAARALGGSFFHVLWKHLLPNFIPAILFMVVMSVRSGIVAESTLSFLGMGLPIETVSWGSMLSLADESWMTGNWWVILIPGCFLLLLLLCITDLGNWLRGRLSPRESQLLDSGLPGRRFFGKRRNRATCETAEKK